MLSTCQRQSTNNNRLPTGKELIKQPEHVKWNIFANLSCEDVTNCGRTCKGLKSSAVSFLLRSFTRLKKEFFDAQMNIWLQLAQLKSPSIGKNFLTPEVKKSMTYVIMFGMETNLCHLVGTTMDRYFQARSRENDSHKGCWVLPGHVLDLGFTLLSEFRYRCLAALAQNVDDISEWAQNGAKPDEWFWIPATAKHTIIYFQHFSKLEQFKGFLKISHRIIRRIKRTQRTREQISSARGTDSCFIRKIMWRALYEAEKAETVHCKELRPKNRLRLELLEREERLQNKRKVRREKRRRYKQRRQQSASKQSAEVKKQKRLGRQRRAKRRRERKLAKAKELFDGKCDNNTETEPGPSSTN